MEPVRDTIPDALALHRRWEPCPLCGSARAEELHHARQHLGEGVVLDTRIDLCLDCDFVFSNPRPDEESLRRFYDVDPNASGQVYHRVGPGSRIEMLAAARVAYIRRHAPGTRSLLDVGCGRGEFLREARGMTDWRLTGVDPSRTAIARSGARGLDLLRANLDEAVAALRPHDTVTLLGVLEHLRDPLRFLARTADLLAPGGRLFIEVPDTARPVPGLVEFFDFEHLGHFTPATLQRMLARAGWRLLDWSVRQREQGRLLACAGRADDPTATSDPPVDAGAERRAVLAAVARYRDAKAKMAEDFRARVAPSLDRWRRSGSRVAIYGAGLHTDYLLDCCPELADPTVCLLDSDPAKQGRTKGRWQVHGPQEIEALGLDAIVVSSQSGEKDIVAGLARGSAGRTEIVTCYGDDAAERRANDS